MTPDVATGPRTATVTTVESERKTSSHAVELPSYEREYYDDVAFMTCMILVLMGNYRGSGHFGGPTAYTPYNVALHLGGTELGGLSYDIREPKHPYTDKFMLAGGHCIPTCYALWIVLYEAMARRHAATGDDRFAVAWRLAQGLLYGGFQSGRVYRDRVRGQGGGLRRMAARAARRC